MLTTPSERPQLPKTVPGYWGVHGYTITQILATVGIFIVTLTKAAPVFPVIIIILIPARLLLMKRLWHRETLRHVDAWACKDGTPEDEEDARAAGTADAGEEMGSTKDGVMRGERQVADALVVAAV